jgi:hypothetical protein
MKNNKLPIRRKRISNMEAAILGPVGLADYKATLRKERSNRYNSKGGKIKNDKIKTLVRNLYQMIARI